jgi:glucosyl-dolichyl phosphate glucuronosyltransferase
MLEISVVIPTRNRAKFLERCLTSLCEQTLDPARYEVCVVNNASSDNTNEIVSAVSDRFSKHNILLVQEPRVGLSRARNCGLGATHAPLIAMGDDDATMLTDWLERYLVRFSELGPNVAVVGGDVIPEWQAPKPTWLTPRMLGILSAASEIGTEPCFIVPPANLFEGNSCYRRDALERAGRFPVELGRIGDCLLSGEGHVNMLIHKHYGRLFFDPAIKIRHVIHAERLKPMWFRQRYFWQGVSGYISHLYYQKHGLNVVNALQLNLPLKIENWAFVNQDTADDLDASLHHMENLGFLLAMTGLIPIDVAGI